MPELLTAISPDLARQVPHLVVFLLLVGGFLAYLIRRDGQQTAQAQQGREAVQAIVAGHEKTVDRLAASHEKTADALGTKVEKLADKLDKVAGAVEHLVMGDDRDPKAQGLTRGYRP